MLVMSEPGCQSLTDDERIECSARSRSGSRRCRPPSTRGWWSAPSPMTACDDPDQHYEFGVRLFIGGVEAIAADGACDHRR